MSPKVCLCNPLTIIRRNGNQFNFSFGKNRIGPSFRLIPLINSIFLKFDWCFRFQLIRASISKTVATAAAKGNSYFLFLRSIISKEKIPD
jgi:hypothetical protein